MLRNDEIKFSQWSGLLLGELVLSYCLTTTNRSTVQLSIFSTASIYNTVRDCNPYDQNNRIRIIILLECAINESTSYLMRWFRENTTGAMQGQGIGSLSFQHSH